MAILTKKIVFVVQVFYVRTLGFALAKGLIRGLTRYPNPPSSNCSVSLMVQWELAPPVRGTPG